MEDSHIAIRKQGHLGLLCLDRPKALNALDHSMISALVDGLAGLVADPQIAHIAITSTSSRAFCAGGDMRRIRQMVVEGKTPEALAFFGDEFALNQAIAECAKPIVALVDGICMGGGLGLSIHARFRIVAPTATFAMPETAIGYFPDVGATYFLNALPGKTGLWLGLTGARLTGEEACIVGLGTHEADASRFQAILDALAASPDLEAVLAQYCRNVPPASVLDSRLDRAFEAADLGAIRSALLEIANVDERAAKALHALTNHSPHALNLAYGLLQAGIGKTLPACLRNEYSALETAFVHPDFVEGIRSVLVDKDHAPQWAR